MDLRPSASGHDSARRLGRPSHNDGPHLTRDERHDRSVDVAITKDSVTSRRAPTGTSGSPSLRRHTARHASGARVGGTEEPNLAPVRELVARAASDLTCSQPQSEFSRQTVLCIGRISPVPSTMILSSLRATCCRVPHKSRISGEKYSPRLWPTSFKVVMMVSIGLTSTQSPTCNLRLSVGVEE